MNRTAFLVSAAIAPYVTLSAAEGQLQSAPFIAASTPIEGDCLPFLAVSQGYFTRAGVNVTINPMNSGEAIAAAIVAGDVAIGSMNTVSLAVAHQNGVDLKIIGAGALYDDRQPGTQLMVRKDSAIHTAHDLDNKTIAVNVLRGSGHLAAQVWIDKNGGTSSTVHFIEMSYSVMQNALEAGRVDAAVISEPSATKARATCRVIAAPHGAIAPVWMIGSYVATSTWIAAHTDAARRIRTALKQTAAWYDTNRAASVAPVAALTKQDPAVVAASQRALFGQDVTSALLQPVIDVAARYGVLKARYPASELIAQL